MREIMAIQRVDPADWRNASTVQVESDAAHNLEALHEIEQWARDNGFARTTEYWLRQAVTPDGKRVFRGVCFRLDTEERRAAENIDRSVEERMSRMPVTLHRT
jgi:hypothetical protein